MNKFTKLFAGLFAVAATSAPASAAVTYIVDNPEAVTITVGSYFGGGDTQIDVVEGENVIEITSNYTTVSLKEVPPYAIMSVVNQNGVSQSISGGQFYTYFFTSDDDVYTVTTKNLDEARTASCKLNIDDSSRVTAKYDGTNKSISLADGENTIKFDPESEPNIIITAMTSKKPIYEVLYNGEKVEMSGSGYSVPLTQDGVIDVTAIIPPTPVTVTVNYLNENSFGAIGAVRIDEEDYTDFDGYTIHMMAGQELGFKANPDYKVDSFKINGEDSYISSGYWASGTLIMSDAVVEVDAHPYGRINFTVNVTDPSHIILYQGYSYENNVIELTSTTNEVSVSENFTTVSWGKAPGCKINSVKVNGEEVYGNYVYDLAEGTVIDFETEAIVLDKKAVVWVNDVEPLNSFELQNKDYEYVIKEAAAGYTHFNFHNDWNSFQLRFYQKSYDSGYIFSHKIYINEEKQESLWGGTSYSLDLNHNDVVKAFFDEDPVECYLVFDIADDVTGMTVTRDLVRAESDLDYIKEGYMCFKGTQVNIAPANDQLDVEVNGVALTPDEDGNHEFVVDVPTTTIKVTKKDDTGVNTITDAAVKDTAVFNLHGIKVAESTENLPAGVYIVAGKKIVVK